MKEFRKALPPLHALVAFEAAARLSSFSAAAQELNISQAAVSQQIRNLEESLGLALFTRMHKAVQLTHLGREYQHTVAAALQQLAAATQELRKSRGRDRMTVAADQSMAWMWLMPRLGQFHEANPGVSVRLVASDLKSDCLADNVDVALIHGDGNWPGQQCALLFAEEVYPVCSPAYLQSAPELRAPQDLLHHTLLHLEDDHWEWMNWRMWLTENGVALPTNQQGLTINNYPLVIEAAVKGQGVALGWRGLVDQKIGDSGLVRPIKESVQTRYGYYAVWREGQAKTRQARIFVDWVSGTARP